MRVEGLFTLQQAHAQVRQERVDAPHRIHTLRVELRQRGDRTEVLYQVHQFVSVEEVPAEHIIVAAPPYTRTGAEMYRAMLETQRAEFEVTMHELSQRNPGGAMSDGGDGTPEALFWRTETGLYGVRQFNAAWYGWLAARGIEP